MKRIRHFWMFIGAAVLLPITLPATASAAEKTAASGAAPKSEAIKVFDTKKPAATEAVAKSEAQVTAIGAAAKSEAEAVSAAEEVADAAAESTAGKSYVIKYRLDSRVMTGNGSIKPNIMAAEAEISGEAGKHWDYAIQIPLYTAMRGRGKEMHFGNLYAIYRNKLGEPTVKLGQFVIPFGNLPAYETHTRPVQTLYPYSLGVRIDTGVEVDGFLNKDTEYQFSVTTGNGPYRLDNNSNKVLTARVNRSFEIGNNELRLGLSALHGSLPVFSVMSDPVMGDGKLQGFSMKNRVAVDAEYYMGPYLLRAEVVAGDDDGKAVYGHWLQFSYPLSYKTSIEVGTERWSQSSGGLTGYWIGLEHKFTDNKIARLVYQTNSSREMGMHMNMPMVTLQYLVEF